MDVGSVLRLSQDPRWELFSVQVDSDDPEHAILQVERGSLNLALSGFICISHHLQVFGRHFDATLGVRVLTCLPALDLVEQHFEDVFAALNSVITLITGAQLHESDNQVVLTTDFFKIAAHRVSRMFTSLLISLEFDVDDELLKALIVLLSLKLMKDLLEDVGRNGHLDRLHRQNGPDSPE